MTPAMLHINGLTYRIGGRLLFDGATAAIAEGHKVGLVGRNGVGKTTLFRLILDELHPESGSIGLPRRARVGTVAQEAPGGAESLGDTVLAAGTERMALLAEAETASDPHRIAEIQTRLADIRAHAAPARAAEILSGLGFAAAAHDRPCAEFSGGWRMRVALAAALFAAPDLLLLDEPTNYLDLEGAFWLKRFIRDYPGTILMVSHDRDFLNEAVDTILHLETGKLTAYVGGYDDFERQRAEKQALSQKLRKKQEEQRRHMQAYVDRFRYKASKARQAQSRLKALAKLQPIAAIVDKRVVPFSFPNPAKPMAPPLLRLERASAGYGEHIVLRNMSLRLDPDDRVALLGANGNGKSTFAKLLCGKLAPLAGTVHRHGKVTTGYFAQHQLDELDEWRTPYDYFSGLMPEASMAERRARLGAVGFGAALADSTCATLSGGEKARLLFALAAFHGPHLLILDEPTNHLDVDSREALIHAINDFEGAIILISHDRHLIEACADRLWLVAGGTVKPFDGDLDDYAATVLSTPKQASAAPERPKAEPARRPVSKRKLDAMEAELSVLGEKIAALDRALADQQLFLAEPKKAAEFSRLRTKLASDLEAAEHAWLSAQIEGATG
jgi:ATP-binding cassette subfamily F protein 3